MLLPMPFDSEWDDIDYGDTALTRINSLDDGTQGRLFRSSDGDSSSITNSVADDELAAYGIFIRSGDRWNRRGCDPPEGLGIRSDPPFQRNGFTLFNLDRSFHVNQTKPDPDGELLTNNVAINDRLCSAGAASIASATICASSRWMESPRRENGRHPVPDSICSNRIMMMSQSNFMEELDTLSRSSHTRTTSIICGCRKCSGTNYVTSDMDPVTHNDQSGTKGRTAESDIAIDDRVSTTRCKKMAPSLHRESNSIVEARLPIAVEVTSHGSDLDSISIISDLDVEVRQGVIWPTAKAAPQTLSKSSSRSPTTGCPSVATVVTKPVPAVLSSNRGTTPPKHQRATQHPSANFKQGDEKGIVVGPVWVGPDSSDDDTIASVSALLIDNPIEVVESNGDRPKSGASSGDADVAKANMESTGVSSPDRGDAKWAKTTCSFRICAPEVIKGSLAQTIPSYFALGRLHGAYPNFQEFLGRNAHPGNECSKTPSVTFWTNAAETIDFHSEPSALSSMKLATQSECRVGLEDSSSDDRNCAMFPFTFLSLRQSEPISESNQRGDAGHGELNLTR